MFDRAANHRRYMREVWYPKNRQKHMKFVANIQNDVRVWYHQLKRQTGCKNCPETDPRCLDYHHRNRKTKKFNISTGVGHGLSKKRILSEMKKCDLLCANCHRKVTWKDYSLA